MERESFAAFVARTLEDVIVLAEETTHKDFHADSPFNGWERRTLGSQKTLSSTIVQRVYRDSEKIYPCVDIGCGRSPRRRVSPDRGPRGGVCALQLPSELDRTRGTIRLLCRESVHGKNGRTDTGMDT